MTTSKPTTAREIDVLFLGAPYVRFDEKTPGTYDRLVAGDCTIAAVATARAGARSGLAGRLGTDVLGDLICDTCAAEGIDISQISRDPEAPTGYVTQLLDPVGGPAFAEGTAAAFLRPGDLSEDKLQLARVLHVSGALGGLSLGAQALAGVVLRQARERGARVSVSLAFDQPGMDTAAARQMAIALLAQSDMAILHLEDARKAYRLSDPQQILDHVLTLGPQVVALWMGLAGAWVATSQGRWHVAPVAAEPVDEAGAGSVFDGYFLSGLTAGEDLLTAATRAMMAAAVAATRPGLMDAVPFMTEVPQ